jgi:hypothetical protein
LNGWRTEPIRKEEESLPNQWQAFLMFHDEIITIGILGNEAGTYRVPT